MPQGTERIREQLRAMLPELARRYGVAELGLFGSHVRGDHRPDSDLDALVASREGDAVSPFAVFDLGDELAARLGLPIVLVAKKNLRDRHRPDILREVRPS